MSVRYAHFEDKISKLVQNPEPSPPPKKTLRKGLEEVYYEYCSNTSVHCIQYLGTRRPLKEVFFWLCVFALSLYFCAQTIGRIYDKWNDTPVIVSFSERSTPISDIPFPAITICSETRMMNNVSDFSYAQLFQCIAHGLDLPANLTAKDRRVFSTLLHMCKNDILSNKEIPRISNETINYIQIMKESAFSLNDQILACKWFGLETGYCEDLFTITYTEDGLCYTFNGLNGTDLYREETVQYQQSLENFVEVSSTGRINRTLTWSLEGGYPKNEPLKTYPARVVSASNRAAFDAGLVLYKNHLDYACGGATQGFKIMIHSPDDVPTLSKGIVRISPQKEVTIIVKPVMVTSDGIIKYPLEKRKCFMKNERYLKFFKVYTDRNCELECLTNYTLKMCECVKFSMPRTADMPVCPEDKIPCYIHAEDKMLMENFKNGDDTMGGCNCLPSCTSLDFDTEISQADADVKRSLEALNIPFKEEMIVSHVVVHFKDNEFITYKRSELYGFYDFVANCGGVLGLFMGFSILSMVEMLYHFTLRLWSNMRHKDGVD